MTIEIEQEKVRLLIIALRVAETGYSRTIEFKAVSEQAMREINREHGNILKNNFPLFKQMDGTFQMKKQHHNP